MFFVHSCLLEGNSDLCFFGTYYFCTSELKKHREVSATNKENEKKKREEAKALAAARVQAKLDAKKNQGKGKGKAK